MKPGSLVVTEYPIEIFLADSERKGCQYIPAPPVRDQIYVVKSVYPNAIVPTEINVDVEEIQIIFPNGTTVGFRAEVWKEVQPPMDLTELLEETKPFELITN